MECLLVSACLLGRKCKYSGGSNENPEVMRLSEKYRLIPVCPEADGGLSTPRPPAEIREERVVNRAGEDVTAAFLSGAKKALKTARAHGCVRAVLKERSPSCGSGQIYDGTFSSRLVKGDGVTAALLKENGIAVYGESKAAALMEGERGLMGREDADAGGEKEECQMENREKEIAENPVLEAIFSRRSVRRFKEEPIPRECLEVLARAAIYAPSGKGLQTWQITIVERRELMERLAKAVEKALDRPGYDMYHPAAIIIPSNERDSIYGREDDACALENIFLAAHSMGIGSVWINQLQNVCDDPEIRAVLDEMGIPKNHVVYGLAALGYSAQEPKRDVVKTGKIVFVE